MKPSRLMTALLLLAGVTALAIGIRSLLPDGVRPAGAAPAATPPGGAAGAEARPAAPPPKAAEPEPDPADLRPPAVAGSFYPAERAALSDAIDGYLRAAPAIPFAKPVRALIVPHAGYVFSGACAARAFKQVAGGDYDRVILIGSPHHAPVRGAALWAKGAWDTPLGRVPVDAAAARAMAAAGGPRVREDAEPHRPDHCLEVELPFLQKLLRPGFAIVPVLVHAGGREEDFDALGAALRAACDARTLIVVSTDLSHFPARSDAEAVDAKTVASWKTLDPAEVASVSRALQGRGTPNLSCTMCGEDAVLALLKAAKSLGIAGLDVVGTAHSASVSRDDRRVVGYGAAALWGDPPAAPLARPGAAGAPAAAPRPGELPAAAGRRLLALARQAVACAAAGKPPPDVTESAPELQGKRGCFVTLHKDGALRGCIGCFDSDEPIYRAVQRMAVASAMHDRRFDPVAPAEVDRLEIEISILSDIAPCPDARAIVLGTHGVIVRKGSRSGVFLPQVATETGWSLEEFLGHLARDKAGIGADGWKDPDARLSTFTVQLIREDRKPGGRP
jgi:AmmeMemoRadiSam system protein B/AmmeMemoRadiSam system protein A